MPIIVKENVEVGDTETEIIEAHETPHDKDRIFSVSNGDKEIEVKAWASEDGTDWEVRETKTISANETATLIVGAFIYFVKLTGKTTTTGDISEVDACLIY